MLGRMIGRSKILLVIVCALLVIGGGIFLATKGNTTVYNSGAVSTIAQEKPIVEEPVVTGPRVTLGETIVPVEVVSTSAAIKKGLSGRSSLNANSGMLFIFSKASRYQFWMPDMHFPIDIIWIEGGKVADISADVPTDFDPKNPVFFKPKVPVRYVLEVNAGFAEAHNIIIGTPVIFAEVQ